MFVALGDREAQACERALKAIPAASALKLTRVAHIRAACERMLVTRPLVVVLPTILTAEDRRLLNERAEDIMAEIVPMPATLDEKEITKVLTVAVRAANAK
jgi:hypothetical protein